MAAESAPRKLMSVLARPMPYGGPNGNESGWTMTYVSSRRTEVLTFTVTPTKTTIIRMRWAPLNLAPERVLVDSSKAIRGLPAAIEDKGTASEEEKSGNDYFLGFKFDQPGGPEIYDNGGGSRAVAFLRNPKSKCADMAVIDSSGTASARMTLYTCSVH